MEHVFYQSEDFKDATEGNLLASWVIDGGLAVCKVCGLLEGALTTDCPGVDAYAEHADKVYAGEIDFVGDEWVNSCSKQSPHHFDNR